MSNLYQCKCGAMYAAHTNSPKSYFLKGILSEKIDGVLCDRCTEREGKPIHMMPLPVGASHD